MPKAPSFGDGSSRPGNRGGGAGVEAPMTFRDHTRALYAAAARTPDASLCCNSAPPWRLPGLSVHRGMLARNYGCGSTIHARELADVRLVLYVGVGAGLKALQAAYFVRRPGGVVGVDISSAMLEVAAELLTEACALNAWLAEDAVELRRGDALALPVEDANVDVAAQNCRFNIFVRDDLAQALGVCDKTAAAFTALGRADFVPTPPTWHYAGEGCC
jgi:SAM-dependent methyltransferase